MSKHTPGHWVVSDAMATDHLYVKNDETGRQWYHSARAIFAGDMILAKVEVNISKTVSGYPTPQSHEELLANARLIAQAPRLLEALEECIGTIQQLQFDHNTIQGSMALSLAEEVYAAATKESTQ